LPLFNKHLTTSLPTNWPTNWPKNRMHAQRTLPTLAPLVAVWLAGCASTAPLPPATPLPVVAAFHASGTTPATPSAPFSDKAGWWAAFEDPALSALVQRALAGNTQLDVAAARLTQARAQLQGSAADRLPQVQAGAAATRQGGPLINAAGGSGTLLQAGLSAQADADLFGRLRQAQSAAGHHAAAQQALLRATQLLVQTDVAQHYLRLRTLDAERTLARQAWQSQQDTLALVEQRWKNGSLTELDVQRARADTFSAEAELLALDRDRQHTQHALALLLGEPASSFTLAEDAQWQGRWPQVPAGIPSEVLARRPDVQAAQEVLQAAQAKRGETRAGAFPSLLLTAAGGQASPSLSTLLQASLRAWSLGALLSAPIFDGGQQAAREAGGDAEVMAQHAQFRGQVLLAFKDVEDQLVALQAWRQQTAVLAQAATAARRAQALADSRFKSGLASQLELLQARRTAWKAERQHLQAQAAQGSATVALVKALGGGWQG
jgi:multidrug efflux system outer membrane protein